MSNYKPDGRKIVYDEAAPWHDVLAGSLLYLKQANGDGRSRRLTRPFDPKGHIGEDTQADWSPDGQSIVFIRTYIPPDGDEPARPPRTGPCAGAEDCVRIYHRGRSRALVPGVYSPVWSVRGWIAFESGDPTSDSSSISIIRPDGSAERRLVTTGYFDSGCDWSPDGRRLAFIAADHRLATIGADGRHLRKLPIEADHPSFSPNGRRLVYQDWETATLYTTDLHGRNRRLLRTRHDLHPISVAAHADWQPLPRRKRR